MESVFVNTEIIYTVKCNYRDVSLSKKATSVVQSVESVWNIVCW